MYIRRKVFSVVEDEMGVERYFSTTEFMNEESYLEQREYAEAEEKRKGLGRKTKIALATAGSAAAATGAAIGGKKLGVALEKASINSQVKKKLGEKFKNATEEQIERAIQKAGIKNKSKIAEILQKPYDLAVRGGKVAKGAGKAAKKKAAEMEKLAAGE